MSQKFIKYKNNNLRSNAFGKFFARAVYDKKPVSTQEIANFIQTQATVKKSDCIAGESQGQVFDSLLIIGPYYLYVL